LELICKSSKGVSTEGGGGKDMEGGGKGDEEGEEVEQPVKSQ
jgi:hypothetical protein